MNPCDEILLVEDDPGSVELTLHAFRKGHLANPVQVARDGVEALDYLFGTGKYAGRDLRNRPALVLLDLKLPRLSGLEVLRRIRADGRTQDLSVVILSMSQEERDIVQSHDFGADGYMIKPIDLDKFAQAMRELGLEWMILRPQVSTVM